MASFNPQKTYKPEPIRVYNSRETTARRVELPSKGAKSITLGDKMFARLILRGKTVLEFMITSVRDLTELYTLLHSKCRGLRGLAKLFLRNMSSPVAISGTDGTLRLSPATAGDTLVSLVCVIRREGLYTMHPSALASIVRI